MRARAPTPMSPTPSDTHACTHTPHTSLQSLTETMKMCLLQDLDSANRNMSGVSDEDMAETSGTTAATADTSSPRQAAVSTPLSSLPSPPQSEQHTPSGPPPPHPPPSPHSHPTSHVPNPAAVRHIPPPTSPEQTPHVPPAVPVVTPSAAFPTSVSAPATTSNSPDDHTQVLVSSGGRAAVPACGRHLRVACLRIQHFAKEACHVWLSGRPVHASVVFDLLG